MTVFPFRQKELDEVLGTLNHIEPSPDGGIVALIGKIPTWLPSELEPRLKELIGKPISVLRLDGYHLKARDGAHAAR